MSRWGEACARIVAAWVLCLLLSSAAAAAEPTVDPGQTRPVAKITGPGPLNLSDARWNLYGADLGSMFEWHGRIYMTFGDSYGSPRTGDAQHFVEERNTDPTRYLDWRSNTMAYFSDASPELGPVFDGMITDPQNPLRAKELLPSAKQVCKNVEGFCEQTVIPTNGFAVGNRMFLHYMSVKRFGFPRPNDYDLNRSGLAYSDDGGHNWAEDPAVTWTGGSNFGQVAAAQTGGHLYLFGIPGGRIGGVKLARVSEDKVLKKSAYRYWDGRRWGEAESSAAEVAGAPVGELSVQWNSYFGKWLMMYLKMDEPRESSTSGDIVLRTADCLTGPWSSTQPVASSDTYPSLYAPFIPPRWNNGPNLYFAMSIFTTYNVWWMRTTLSGDARPGRKPCVTR